MPVHGEARAPTLPANPDVRIRRGSSPALQRVALPSAPQAAWPGPVMLVRRPAATTVTVLIADDDVAIRLALADLVSDEFGLTLVAAAADAEEAITLASKHQPAVAVLDVRMPGGGVRAAREIR